MCSTYFFPHKVITVVLRLPHTPVSPATNFLHENGIIVQINLKHWSNIIDKNSCFIYILLGFLQGFIADPESHLLVAPLALAACLRALHLMTLTAVRSTEQAFYRTSFIPDLL